MGRVALFIPGDRNLPCGVEIEGTVACCICQGVIDQSHVDRGEIFLATGKRTMYPVHVAHFYTENPATGNVDTPTDDYQENLALYAMAYGIGEGLTTVQKG